MAFAYMNNTGQDVSDFHQYIMEAINRGGEFTEELADLFVLTKTPEGSAASWSLDMVQSVFGGDISTTEQSNEPMIRCIYCPDWNMNTRYELVFPLSELSNAVSLCGWTLLNQIERTAAIDEEVAKLQHREYLEIPEGREWFSKHATLVVD